VVIAAAMCTGIQQDSNAVMTTVFIFLSLNSTIPLTGTIWNLHNNGQANFDCFALLLLWIFNFCYVLGGP